MAVYEVIVSSGADAVYRLYATSEEAAREAAMQKFAAGEKPLYENIEDLGQRVRLVEPDPPAPVRTPTPRARKKKDFLDTKEAAYELGVTKWTVTRYIQRGILKATKLGPQWRIERSEVERLLREGY